MEDGRRVNERFVFKYHTGSINLSVMCLSCESIYYSHMRRTVKNIKPKIMSHLKI